MMQGDSYGLEIEILDHDNFVVTPEDISDVEITVGFLRKSYKKGEIFYVADDANPGRWIFPLSQKETFKLPISQLSVQVRIMWPNKEVEGATIGQLSINESHSKEVLL